MNVSESPAAKAGMTKTGGVVTKVLLAGLLCAGVSLAPTVAAGGDADASPITCPEGFKLGIYESPKEGTRPWRDKHVRCEKIDITCPPLMKPVYHDTEVYGSTPLDNGTFVRCEEIQGPPN